jgi:DNA-binding transcriptional LysR family regulator
MDFDQLNTFLEVARLNSFSRAAVKCFRTQPAISAQIRLLEEDLGARLLDRGGGRVTLTAAGRSFLPFAERLLLLRKEAAQAVADLEQSPRGELMIAANEGSCLHVLPHVISSFKRQHAAVQLQIRRGEHNEILEAVLENRVDFGVLSLPVQDSRLQIVPLHRDELCAVVRAGHPLGRAAADRGEAAVEEIVRYPLLLPHAGNTRDSLDEVFAPFAGRLHISMELESTELIKAFSAAGLGVGFVGRTLAAAEQRSGELEVLPIAGRKIYRELGLIFRRDRALSRAALAFINIAVKSADLAKYEPQRLPAKRVETATAGSE